MRRFWSIAALFLFAGCASLPLDLKALKEELPARAYVANVPLVEQKREHCGPAALSMAFGWAGRWVEEGQLAPSMLTPDKSGTFQADLLGAARREGFLAVPVKGYRALFREISEGRPVVVLENLGLSWMPKWHYAVVVGYDLDREEVELNAGGSETEKMSLRRFDLAWSLGESWAVVVLPPSLLSATGDEVDHLEAAAALERIGLRVPALVAYETILGRWPRSLGAWIGIGNVRFTEGDEKGALAALKKATAYHPESPAAWHNLALTHFALRQDRAAKAAAQKAIRLAQGAESGFYVESLRPVLGE